MSSNKVEPYHLLYLFYRLREPIFFPKFESEKVCFFDLRADQLPRKYGKDGNKVLERFRMEEGYRIDVGNMLNDNILDVQIDKIKAVKIKDHFSVFHEKHQEAASQLIGIFLGYDTVEDLIAYAAYCRDRVNPELFAYSLASAILHHKDTNHLELPPYQEIFPELFLSGQTILEAKEMSHVLTEPGDRMPIEIRENLSGNNRNLEHRMAYFREDIGVNLHHWHWHLVHPYKGPEVVLKKDRRGELFYYMHNQVMSRFNIERLCNDLDLVERLLDWSQPIEGYFPGLSLNIAGRPWTSRPDGMKFRNINRSDIKEVVDLEDMLRYKERIYEAIHKRKVIDSDGNEIDINNDKGIDILGNIVEASELSPNLVYYGSLHNLGHDMIALSIDPKFEYNQGIGVAGLPHTAMRDPVFYKWHAFINDIFIEHKNTLSSYKTDDLKFENIQITDIKLQSFNESKKAIDMNVIHTFFMKSDVNMTRGLDFARRGPILVRFTHLNHNEFTYSIKVVNTSRSTKYGTVRIFLAPTSDVAKFTLELPQQKELMIEMDKFVAELRPGESKILRKSTDSSVTIPFEQTFRNLDAGRPKDSEIVKLDKFNFCGCGWPQHMLVPKGTVDGYPMVLFAMISDYNQDRAENLPYYQQKCKSGISFCGLRDKKYPDKRPMGYPFDRRIRKGVTTLQEFLTPNMSFTPITILHSNNLKQND